jgi:hypothetical protein
MNKKQAVQGYDLHEFLNLDFTMKKMDDLIAVFQEAAEYDGCTEVTQEESQCIVEILLAVKELLPASEAHHG